MKKFELLGRSLTKEEQKKVVGGFVGEDGCTWTYTGCNFNGTLTCDYHVECTSTGSVRDLCGFQCIGNDGSGCGS